MSHKHNSEAVATLTLMIRNLRTKRDAASIDGDTFEQNMAILLSILEPILINDVNLEFLYKLNMVSDLTESLMEQPLPSEVQTWRPKAFFRFLLRALTSALRNEYGV